MKKLLILLCALVLFANDVNLTKEEKNYINSHTFKCIISTSWAPFNTMINGKLEGISVDFWKLVKKKLHLKSHCIIAPSWSTVLDAIKHKRADLTIGTDITSEKKKFAIFSKPYATFPIAIATKNDVGFIGSMIFLQNKKIAVGKNYTAAQLLKKYFPNYKIIEVENTKKALELVNKGEAYAAIDIMPVLVYNINKYEFANLKIAGKTPWKFQIRFMLSKDNELLVSAINKAIDTITDKQKKEIYKKWIHVTYQQGYSLKQVLLIVFVSFIIIVALVYWIRMLKKEINKRKEIEKELQKLSIIDSLTGIFNRYKIDTALKQQISYSKRHHLPLSVIFFDIDHFKKINDTYGHRIGDKILKEIADIIKHSLREYDIFGRWGGEEFIIILPNTNLLQAIKVAKKLKSLIENHRFKYIDGLTCSFGVTELMPEDNSDSILIRVDSFMYEAKKRGRNQIVSDLNFKF
ncbi:putative diguanylate cyclase [Nautilia profundicola AmH]|uniref:diguanylate cyclase n=1 Tax=Nautilia profundicola (strain ATCC BAA-1463 / DSM 18972 / AmH) TaxID=598659 RepID=B9L5Q1_NAUPA|nr:diguanylate cyclase [Nautilia profundicola]ACM92130.1 putative diguanylate cyclase [Nautilia profundicola AmH]